MKAQPFMANLLGEDVMKTVQTMLAEAEAEVPRISPMALTASTVFSASMIIS